MIVECRSCGTRFQLDDSRVPTQGIRVRCSRCKQAFHLEHPSAAHSEAIAAVAEEAVHRDALPPPDATQDLPAHTALEDLAGPAAEAPGEVVGGDFEDEESDWEFNSDLPGGVGDTEVGADDEMRIEHFGSAEELGALTEPDQPPTEPDLEAVPELARPEPARSSITSEAVDQLLESVSGGARESEVDDPEDWDFFSDEALETEGIVGSDRAQPSAAAGGIGAELEEAAPHLQPGAGERAADPFDSQQGRAGPIARGLRGIGRSAGWLVTAGLLGLGLVRGLEHGGVIQAEPPGSVALGRFEARAVEGHWIENASSGQLFVVSGRLHNPAHQGAVPGVGLQAVLLDASGEAIEAEPAALAPTPPERELREQPLSTLRASQARRAAALAWGTIPAGETVDFVGFFAGLPSAAKRFKLETTRVAAPPVGPTTPTSSPR